MENKFFTLNTPLLILQNSGSRSLSRKSQQEALWVLFLCSPWPRYKRSWFGFLLNLILALRHFQIQECSAESLPPKKSVCGEGNSSVMQNYSCPSCSGSLFLIALRPSRSLLLSRWGPCCSLISLQLQVCRKEAQESEHFWGCFLLGEGGWN